jgi:hypothetical protein
MPHDLAVNERFSVQTQTIGHEHQPVIIKAGIDQPLFSCLPAFLIEFSFP